MFGIAHQIIDRSASEGASSISPITTSNLPHVITSASNCAFSASHYCSNGLVQDGDARSLPAGFYIYYNQARSTANTGADMHPGSSAEVPSILPATMAR